MPPPNSRPPLEIAQAGLSLPAGRFLTIPLKPSDFIPIWEMHNQLVHPPSPDSHSVFPFAFDGCSFFFSFHRALSNYPPRANFLHHVPLLPPPSPVQSRFTPWRHSPPFPPGLCNAHDFFLLHIVDYPPFHCIVHVRNLSQEFPAADSSGPHIPFDLAQCSFLPMSERPFRAGFSSTELIELRLPHSLGRLL